MNPDLLVASYTVKDVLDPFKDDIIKYLVQKYEDTSISTPKEAVMGQSLPGKFSVVIGEPAILESKFKTSKFDLKVFSNRLDVIKKFPENLDSDLEDLFSFLDVLVDNFAFRILRAGCVLILNKEIKKDITSKLYKFLFKKDEEEIVGFTHETIKRLSNFYNLMITVKALKKHKDDGYSTLLGTLVDSNTLPSENFLNNERSKHCKELSMCLSAGWEKVSTIVYQAGNGNG
jgi:hypothetical protein